MNHRPLRRELSALSLALLMVLAQTSFSRPTRDFDKPLQTPQQPRPLPPTQYIPDHDFDTRHVALDLRFDWEHEQLIGIETMALRQLLANLKSIELDAADMTITLVKLVNGGPLQFEMDPINQKLRIALGRAYQPTDELISNCCKSWWGRPPVRTPGSRDRRATVPIRRCVEGSLSKRQVRRGLEWRALIHQV